MEIIILLLFLAVIPAAIASNKGYSGFGWWLYGVLLLPVAFFHSLFLKPRAGEMGMKKCPFCAEVIKSDATVCRYCARDLPQRESAAPVPLGQRHFNVGWLLLGGVGVLIFLIVVISYLGSQNESRLGDEAKSQAKSTTPSGVAESAGTRSYLAGVPAGLRVRLVSNPNVVVVHHGGWSVEIVRSYLGALRGARRGPGSSGR